MGTYFSFNVLGSAGANQSIKPTSTPPLRSGVAASWDPHSGSPAMPCRCEFVLVIPWGRPRLEFGSASKQRSAPAGSLAVILGTCPSHPDRGAFAESDSDQKVAIHFDYESGTPARSGRLPLRLGPLRVQWSSALQGGGEPVGICGLLWEPGTTVFTNSCPL
jgi:hypothetical protein